MLLPWNRGALTLIQEKENQIEVLKKLMRLPNEHHGEMRERWEGTRGPGGLRCMQAKTGRKG
jgi:hypothetical protein